MLVQAADLRALCTRQPPDSPVPGAAVREVILLILLGCQQARGEAFSLIAQSSVRHHVNFRDLLLEKVA